MSPSEHELELVFKRLCDEELLARCESGTITEEAKTIATREARLRGLNPTETQPIVENDETYYGEFVFVARNLNLAEAHLYKTLLEAAGVPAEVGDANFSRAFGSLYSASVKVPEAFVAEAKEVFAAFKRGDFALDDEFEPDGT